jgi:hypothetical protein
LQRIQNVQEGKRHQKKRQLAAFVFVPSIFWENFPTAEVLNDIGRNFLLGNRKKIAKYLMTTFTCRSTFLYVMKIPTFFLFRLTVCGSTRALSRQLSYAGCMYLLYTERGKTKREREVRNVG